MSTKAVPQQGGFIDRLLARRTRMGQMARRVRRFYYGVFRADYIKANVAARREGECHRCGLCCQLVYKCPFLGKDADQLPYCRIYGDLRPTNCHSYPFDKVDSEVDQCGFKFKDEDRPRNR
jgi:hypothetical protein